MFFLTRCHIYLGELVEKEDHLFSFYELKNNLTGWNQPPKEDMIACFLFNIVSGT